MRLARAKSGGAAADEGAVVVDEVAVVEGMVVVGVVGGTSR